MSPDPKAVFDCNVFVQAFFNAEGPAASCIRLVENDVVTLVLSAEILAEVRSVLNRPKLQRKFPAASPEVVDEFLRQLLDRTTWVEEVSRDNDLLDLMKETDAGKDFRRSFPELTILSPVAFLHEMQKANAQRDDE